MFEGSHFMHTHQHLLMSVYYKNPQQSRDRRNPLQTYSDHL